MGIIVNSCVIILLFYAAVLSKNQSSKIHYAWLFLAVAQISFFLGDIIWGFFDIGLFFQNTNIADFFYIFYYFLFIIGIFFFSRGMFKSKNHFKALLDILIVIVSVAMIFLTLLILPLFSSMETFQREFVIALIYVFLDFLLFTALVTLLYNIINKTGQTALFLLAMGAFFQIITDFVYTYYTIIGGYKSGDLIDAGWVIGYIFVGLAAITQIKGQKIDFKRLIPKKLLYFNKYNLGTYIPLFLIAIAYISQIWGYNHLHSNYLILLDYGVGILVFLVIARQIIALRENKSLYGAAKEEISKREIVEKELQKSEKKYREIVENANEGIISMDLEGVITFVNHRFAEMIGYEEKELLGMNILSLVDDESFKIVKDCCMNIKTGKKSQNELKFIKKDGKSIHVLNNVSSIGDNDEFIGCLALISDITEIKKSDEIIKQSLKEKDTLLREVHHRVKNNMQIISSMLSLQSNRINDQEVLDIFKESQNRVKSMALVHEKIYKSCDMSKIEVKEYINDIIYYLFSLYVLNPGSIDFDVNIENIYFDIDTAIPVALIVNELVTNSLKYAFPVQMDENLFNLKNSMKIEIDIKSNNDKYEMMIKDNGIGLREDFDFDNVSTLGLKIVKVLVGQIKGNIEVLDAKGTVFRIIFKKKYH